MLIGNREWSRAEIEAHCGHLHQVAGVRHYACAEGRGRGRGVRVAEVRTGSGMCFTVDLDRGLDIVQCNFKGLGLVYLSPGGISHPAFHDPAGSEWLR